MIIIDFLSLIVALLVIWWSSINLISARCIKNYLLREIWLASLICVISFSVCSMLLLGVTGKLNLISFWLVICIFAIISRLISRSKSLAQDPAYELIIKSWHELKDWWSSSDTLIKIATGMWIGVQLYCLWFIISFPPFANDILGYHLPNVAKWYQAERIHQIASPNWASNALPMNQELLALSTVVLMGNDLLVELGHFLLMPILILSTYSLSYLFSKDRRLSWLAAIGLSTTPAFFLQSVTNHSDYFLASLFIACLYWLFSWFRSSSDLKALMLAVCAGLMVGSKPQGLHALVVLIGLSIMMQLFYKKAPVKQIARLMLAVMVGIALMGSFWYLKNYHFFNNPFFPFEVALPGFTFKNPPGSFPLQSYGISWENLITNSEYVIRQLSVVSPQFHPDLAFINGWGFWFIIPGWILIWMGIWFNKSYRFLTIALLIFFIIIFASISYQPLNNRFVMAVFILPYVALPIVASRLPDLFKKMLVLSIIFQLAVIPAAGFRFGILDRHRLNEITSRPLLARYASLMMPWLHDKIKTIHELPIDEPVGYFGEQNELAYILYDPELKRKVYYIEPSSIESILDKMRDLNIFYLVAEPTPRNKSIISKMQSTESLSRMQGSPYIFIRSRKNE